MQFKHCTATDYENILVKLQGYFLSLFFFPESIRFSLKHKQSMCQSVGAAWRDCTLPTLPEPERTDITLCLLTDIRKWASCMEQRLLWDRDTTFPYSPPCNFRNRKPILWGQDLLASCLLIPFCSYERRAQPRLSSLFPALSFPNSPEAGGAGGPSWEVKKQEAGQSLQTEQRACVSLDEKRQRRSQRR